MLSAFPVNDQVDRRLRFVDRGDDLLDEQPQQAFADPMISGRMIPDPVELACELEQGGAIRKRLRPLLSAQRFEPSSVARRPSVTPTLLPPVDSRAQPHP